MRIIGSERLGDDFKKSEIKKVFIQGVGEVEIDEFKKQDLYKNTRDLLVFLRITINNIREMLRIGAEIKEIEVKDPDEWGDIERDLDMYLKKYKEDSVGILEMPFITASLYREREKPIMVKKKEGVVEKTIGNIFDALKDKEDDRREIGRIFSAHLYKEVKEITEGSLKKTYQKDRESFLICLERVVKHMEGVVKLAGNLNELSYDISKILKDDLDWFGTIKRKAKADLKRYKK
jgi:hypothetical protein